jgi:NAD(P)-dependent dehydrogenase (short-subunit alcohol dehydrogenase family)
MKRETVLITGGAKRVGRAIALACARAGVSVGITYRSSEDEAQQVVEELRAIGSTGQRFAAFRADVSIAADVEQLAQDALQTFGSVTALVNNAAIFRRTPFEQMTEADFDDHIAANLKGPYLMSKRFGDIFLAQGRGSILNIADIYGLRPLKNYVPYCISKAGVVMLTEATAKALAPHVRVNCICPGTILLPSETQGEDDGESADDEATLLARIPMGRLGTPEEIAETALFLIGGPQFITGAILPVDGAQRFK